MSLLSWNGIMPCSKIRSRRQQILYTYIRISWAGQCRGWWYECNQLATSIPSYVQLIKSGEEVTGYGTLCKPAFGRPHLKYLVWLSTLSCGVDGNPCGWSRVHVLVQAAGSCMLEIVWRTFATHSHVHFNLPLQSINRCLVWFLDQYMSPVANWFFMLNLQEVAAAKCSSFWRTC